MKMEQRYASAERSALVSLLGLLGLTVAKGAAGWLTGSKALLADACHSAADCAGSLTSFMGIRNSKQSEAKKQTESAIAIVLSAFLLVAGIEIGVSSVRSMAAGADQPPEWGAVIVIVAGIGAREALARYKRSKDIQLGIRTERSGESRSDIFASITALVGTTGAIAGDLLDIPILYVMDPAAGIVIAAFVLRMGYRLIMTVLQSTGRSALNEIDAQTLLESMQRIDGVVAVEELRAREQGHYLVLDVVIRVNPRISVTEGQEIALRVKRHLTKRFLHICDACVQVQPYDPGFPYKSNHHEEEMPSFIQ